VKLSDITIQHPGGGTRADALLQLAEKEKEYPEPNMFGTTPAHGFFVRHVKGIELSGIKVDCPTQDERPAFVLDDVRDADLRFLKLPATQGTPSIVLRDTRNFSAFRCQNVPDTELAETKQRQL